MVQSSRERNLLAAANCAEHERYSGDRCAQSQRHNRPRVSSLGTSLMRRMLDAHSLIHYEPQVKVFRDCHNNDLIDQIQQVRFMTSTRRTLPEPRLLNILGRDLVVLHERVRAGAHGSIRPDRARKAKPTLHRGTVKRRSVDDARDRKDERISKRECLIRR